MAIWDEGRDTQRKLVTVGGSKSPTFTSSGPLPTSAAHHEVEFISVPEWCRRVGCSLDAGYRAARRDEIVGLFRVGRLMRVNWQAFVAATFGLEGSASGAEELQRRPPVSR